MKIYESIDFILYTAIMTTEIENRSFFEVSYKRLSFLNDLIYFIANCLYIRTDQNLTIKNINANLEGEKMVVYVFFSLKNIIISFVAIFQTIVVTDQMSIFLTVLKACVISFNGIIIVSSLFYLIRAKNKYKEVSILRLLRFFKFLHSVITFYSKYMFLLNVVFATFFYMNSMYILFVVKFFESIESATLVIKTTIYKVNFTNCYMKFMSRFITKSVK